ncbi:MAG: hypothetical protein K9J74_06515 [Sulfuritalea sp.]|nr:hypothetical protein [Sulfuritalea sp.]
MRALFLIDSITEITTAMADAVVVSGSHGGRSAAGFALDVRPRPYAVFFNDAGIGKDGAGIVALGSLEEAGVVAASYGHESACIGDASDGLTCGVVSAANALARAAGLKPGQSVAAAVEVLRRLPENIAAGRVN